MGVLSVLARILLLYLSLFRPSSAYLATYFHHRQKDNIIHHSSLLSTVNVKVKDIVTSLFINLLYTYQRLRTSSSELSTVPSQFSSFQARTKAVAEQTATTIMPTMPTITRPNNLTNFDDNNPHKMSPFYHVDTGSPAFMYFSIMAQFILLTFAGVFVLGFLLCFIRYRLRLFRRVNVIVRIWARDIAWKIRDLLSGRGSWPWTRQSSRHGLPPNRRRGGGSV